MNLELKNAATGAKVENCLLTASNLWNTPLSLWGLSRIDIPEDAEILDIGCCGGKNLERLTKLAPKGHVSGMDESFRAVNFAFRLNEEAIGEGRCQVYEGSADILPFGAGKFDLVVVEDTFFFWEDPAKCFKEISRVMKAEGKILLLLSKGGLAPLDKFFAALIPGMQAYGRDDIRDLLEDAGFRDVETASRLGALVVTAVKPLSLPARAKRRLNLPDTIPYSKLAVAALGVLALGAAAAAAASKKKE